EPQDWDTHTQRHTQTHTQTHTQRHTQRHTHTDTHRNTQRNTQTHTDTQINGTNAGWITITSYSLSPSLQTLHKASRKQTHTQGNIKFNLRLSVCHTRVKSAS